MLYRDHETNEWKLMPLKATFLQHEREHEQYVIDEDDLRPYEEMAHIDNLEFEEVDYDQDVINRLNEVKDYPESEMQTVSEYVLNNNVLEGTGLATQKQSEMLEASVLELTMMMGGF